MINPAHFNNLYQADADPWNVTSDWYERRKRELVLASLPRERYRHGFEPGCGNGEMTMRLLDRCDQLCAVDFSEKAVQLCIKRTDHVPEERLDLRTMPLPFSWPDVPHEGFDLIIVSEIAYYFDDEALARFYDQSISSLSSGGHLLMCHWRHPEHDRQQNSETLHQRLKEHPHLSSILLLQDLDFEIGVWIKHMKEES